MMDIQMHVYLFGLHVVLYAKVARVLDTQNNLTTLNINFKFLTENHSNTLLLSIKINCLQVYIEICTNRHMERQGLLHSPLCLGRVTIKGHKLCTTYWPVPVGEIERGEKIPHSVNTLFYSFFPFLFNLIMLSLPSFSLCQEAEII